MSKSCSLSFRLSFTSLNHLFLRFYLPGPIPFCVLKEYLFFPFCIMSCWSLCKSSLPFIFCWWERGTFSTLSGPGYWCTHPRDGITIHRTHFMFICIAQFCLLHWCADLKGAENHKIHAQKSLENSLTVSVILDAFTMHIFVYILEIVSKYPMTYYRL